MIVADFSMNNGRENRNNGNQEKGKKEKEALRRSVRSQKRGTPKASPKFLCGCSRLGFINRRASERERRDSGRAFPGLGTIHGRRRNCSESRVVARSLPRQC